MRQTAPKPTLKTLTAVAAATLFGLATTTALAGGPRTPGIDKRQQHQRTLIRDNARAGHLNVREALRLAGQQARIERRKRRFAADGHVSGGERLRLHRALTGSRRAIYRHSNDARTR